MLQYRLIGKEVLGSILTKYMKSKKIDTIEEKIWNKLQIKFADSETEKDLEKEYLNTIYEFLNITMNKKNVLEDVDILIEKDIWSLSCFEGQSKGLKEKDDFISSSFTVEEGAMTCDKCGSKKTLSQSKQLRSADEGFSTLCMCVNCGAKWRIN